MLTRGRLASTMENFKPSFLAALEDEEIVERYNIIFEPMFKTLMLPVTSKLTDTVAMLSQSITSLKKEMEEKDSIIRELQGSVSRLHVTVDDLEQHGRRESMRVFGLPETTPGSTDDKVLELVNNRMKLQPPLSLDVSHRVGQVKPMGEDGAPPPPRPLLVKFVSRRSKARVMEVRKRLRVRRGRRRHDGGGDADNEGVADEEDSNEEREDHPEPQPIIYISDDLTKTRATLAFRARESKQQHLIADTWIIDSKVMIKDNRSRIYHVKSEDELKKHQSRM